MGLIGLLVLLGALLNAPLASSKRHMLRRETLQVALSGGDYPSLDPALSNSSVVWQLLYSTCLKLVNYPDAPGKEGTRLVPDGAVAMPVVSDHGRTYTFTIKDGQRFNTGASVTAANFKAAFDRAADPAMASSAPTYMYDLVGVDAELHQKANGVSGIVAQGMKLTIHTKRADPTLLERLAMPYFCAIPTNLPHGSHGVDAPASAGPYYISSRTVGENVVLTKNPFYGGSRPRRMNKIVITTGVDQATTYLQVRRGQYATDLAGPPSADLAHLAREFGVNKKRFFVDPTLNTSFFSLNTARPALRNVNLRKAINYALDRRALANLSGYGNTPTSQLLPIALSGGRTYNVYPVTRPNLAKAKALLPNGKCGKLVYWTGPDSSSQVLAQALQSELRKIGCNVVLQLVSGNIFYIAAGIRGAAYDILPMAWFSYPPDPFDILYHSLDGNTLTPKNNFNFSYIDNPDLNKAIERANLLPLGPKRLQAFAQIDRNALRDLAPVAPLAHVDAPGFVAPNVGGYTYSTFGAVGADLNTLYWH